MTDPPVSIRPALPDDTTALRAFLQPFIEQKSLLPRSMEELSVLSEHGFVAQHDGTIVGFAAIEIYSRKMAEVQSLAVDAAFQRQGIGRRLVVCCVQRAREQGVAELMAITASERLFRECGFDYSLPNQKRALFLQTHMRDGY